MNKDNPPFIGCDRDFHCADIVLFGAPFDGTASYRPGARFATAEIRQASYGLETYSPVCDRDLGEINVCDLGDLELPFGNPRRALDAIAAKTRTVAAAGKVPILLGGEHLVTLGAVEALAEKERELRILHFDAHADLRDTYLGESLSHATVLRRCHDLLGDGRIFQLGIRSMTKEEADFAASHLRQHRYDLDAGEDFWEEIAGFPLYITIDLDVIDPGFFPGTGTPEPCGVTPAALFSVFRRLQGIEIVGCDLVELAPHYDHSGISAITAAKALRELLLHRKETLRNHRFRSKQAPAPAQPLHPTPRFKTGGAFPFYSAAMMRSVICADRWLFRNRQCRRCANLPLLPALPQFQCGGRIARKP